MSTTFSSASSGEFFGGSSAKTSIAAAATLTSSEKSELLSACKKAASGDLAGARAAYQQVCETVVKDTVPSGSAQTLALSSCKDIGTSAATSPPATTTGPTLANHVTAAELLAAHGESAHIVGEVRSGERRVVIRE